MLFLKELYQMVIWDGNVAIWYAIAYHIIAYHMLYDVFDARIVSVTTDWINLFCIPNSNNLWHAHKGAYQVHYILLAL